MLDFQWLFNFPIWHVWVQAASIWTGQIGQYLAGTASAKLSYRQGLRTNQIENFVWHNNNNNNNNNDNNK